MDFVKIALAAACTALLSLSALARPSDITPAPVEVKLTEGTVDVKALGQKTTLVGGPAFKRKTASLPDFAREEAYRITVSRKGIRIEANTDAGVFYAERSLELMLRSGDEQPCCVIYDYPRFPYRGMHLDNVRHYRDKDFILKQIDAFALVKLNRLHLHLTDGEGWRLQIDSRPRLAGYAAWRPQKLRRDWIAAGRTFVEEGTPGAYGGYLTHDDVREIVAYAAERHITVIPEIEMPGHSYEVLAAYPELACRSEVRTGDLCPGNEATYAFLEDVLTEVMELFPSPYIHIGGDEASKRSWPGCELCQRRMEEEGLSDVDELQSYLIRRIEKFLNAHGRSIIGWDEILQGGLAPNATVMSWRGIEGGREAVLQGHDAIMTPQAYCYFDHVQDAPPVEPESIGGYTPLANVYAYDPLDGIPADAPGRILGIQANLWHEYIPEPEHTEYMYYPRAFAIAEDGWSQPEHKDYAQFRERALMLNEILVERGYHPFDLAHEYGERRASLAPLSHLGAGKPVSYACQYARRYAAGGDGALTDGLMGHWGFRNDRWQGFLEDIDVTVDLGSVQPVHYVGATFMGVPGAEIFLPAKAEVYLSEDGEHFTLAGEILSETPRESDLTLYIPYGAVFQAEARYVRYRAVRTKGWIFTDEIVIN